VFVQVCSFGGSGNFNNNGVRQLMIFGQATS